MNWKPQRTTNNNIMDAHPDTIVEYSESDAQTSYPISRKIVGTHTKFCKSVVIADSPVYGRMLFTDGQLQSASADEHIYHESLVHPVMTRSTENSRVLVVGGGEGATVREVLKWAPGWIDWVDIDSELVNLCRENLHWADEIATAPNVGYRAMDIQDFNHLATGSYNIIILDLPDPDESCEYLYSPEFWRDLKDRKLHPRGGSIATHCGPVRPFGEIGEGYQRILQAATPILGPCWFYAQPIPSFQSEWGFMVFNTAESIPPRDLPTGGLWVVDDDVLEYWRKFQQSRLWRAFV